MEPRTGTIDPAEEPEKALLLESDRSLLTAAEEADPDRVHGDFGVHLGPDELPTPQREATDEGLAEKPTFGRPRADDFITVRGGGLYLTARRRIVWMRGEPVAHPDWTIDTYAEEIERGEYKAGRVTGGYVRMRANVLDETGRLIATGTKTEYGERFTDFVEKAETGAIARALAVAGYGTEAALDLDEGTENDRIADAPVVRPIVIGPSGVPGLRQGGHQSTISTAQINEIARQTGTPRLRADLVAIIESVSGTAILPAEAGAHPNARILKALQALTFEQAAAVIGRLPDERTFRRRRGRCDRAGRSGWQDTPEGGPR